MACMLFSYNTTPYHTIPYHTTETSYWREKIVEVAKNYVDKYDIRFAIARNTEYINELKVWDGL